MLVQHLPDRARVWGTQGWGRDVELAASIVDLLGLLNHNFARANSKKPPRGKPTPLPRPWDTRRKPKSARQALLEVARQLSGPGG